MLRSATLEDIPAIVDVQCRAFHRDTPEDRRRVEHDLRREWLEYVVLERDGEMIASAHVARHWLRVGRCSVLKGDVGHVAVRPELQGAGYGTTFMRKIVHSMGVNGFHISRLGGLMKFYARFGYEPFLRRYVHIPVPRFSASLKGQNWGELLQVGLETPSGVRPYHPARDAAAVHRLRYQFDATRTGQRVIDPEPSGNATGEPDPAGLMWVYDDGQLRGYLRGALGLVHAGDVAPSYRVDELAFAPTCPESVGALVKTLMQRAQDRAPTTLICRLPYDEGLFAALTAADIAFEVVEWHQAADGNMMRVVNLPATLRAVAPELSARLAGLPRLPWEGTVRLALPEDAAVLDIRQEGVQVTSDDGELVIEASHADFLKWLLGIAGFTEFPQQAALTPPQRLVFGCLFPRLPCAAGPWG
jgi:predicted N-acetyltransferase YhbS